MWGPPSMLFKNFSSSNDDLTLEGFSHVKFLAELSIVTTLNCGWCCCIEYKQCYR
jgi:hypothetical protein